MLNKLTAFISRYQLLQPGDSVVCAVSGGADSVALLFALYLLKDKLQINLSAAHFNHLLRGEESDRDEAFVRSFCSQWEIPLHVGSQKVVSGAKGIEAAARDARYAFLKSLPGKIATAHTANDNAETVLMHLVRGTGLKGMGAIAPVRGNIIRPMLDITRQEVLDFLDTYHLQYVLDSSNETDDFLRNRLRHHVIPMLERENPRFAENSSALALRLREDEQVLSQLSQPTRDVQQLRQMPSALRSRAIAAFLHDCGVREPEATHIALVENVINSKNPSAKVDLPGGVSVVRNYNTLEIATAEILLQEVYLPCPGEVVLKELGLTVICEKADSCMDTIDTFTVKPAGKLIVRSRRPGDKIRLHGGTKELRKVFIDRKIPAASRSAIPVIADENGVVGVYDIGGNRSCLTKELPAVTIRFKKI